MSLFKKATREKAKLRLAAIGPAGSGKTFTALSIALGLGGRVGLIDTEYGSANKYAGDFDFLHAPMPPPYDPRNYVGYIGLAAQEGIDVLIIDSLSHAWNGKGGALELVDQRAAANRGNSFAGWKDVTPLQNSLVDAILGFPGHIIATMRSKSDYVVEPNPNTGKMTPRKIGLAPIQREGMDYEFDVVLMLDEDHNAIVTKTRCAALDGRVFNRAGKGLADELTEWLEKGSAASQVSALPAELIGRLEAAMKALGMTEQQRIGALSKRGAASVAGLTESDARELLQKLEERLPVPNTPKLDPLSQAVIERAEAITTITEFLNETGLTLTEMARGAGFGDVTKWEDLNDEQIETLRLTKIA